MQRDDEMEEERMRLRGKKEDRKQIMKATSRRKRKKGGRGKGGR